MGNHSDAFGATLRAAPPSCAAPASGLSTPGQDPVYAASKAVERLCMAMEHYGRGQGTLRGIDDYDLVEDVEHPHLEGLCKRLDLAPTQFAPHRTEAEDILRRLRVEQKPYAATLDLMQRVMAWPELTHGKVELCLDMIDTRKAHDSFVEFFTDDLDCPDSPKLELVPGAIKAVAMDSLCTGWINTNDRPLLECLTLEQMERVVGVVGAAAFPWRMRLNDTVVFPKCAVNTAIILKLMIDRRLDRAKTIARRLSRPSDGDTQG